MQVVTNLCAQQGTFVMQINKFQNYRAIYINQLQN